MTITDEELAKALRARADWLDLPRDVEAPRPYISREQFRAAASAIEQSVAEIERLREALRFYANPEIYKAHPHGPAFDDRDLSFAARAALEKT